MGDGLNNESVIITFVYKYLTDVFHITNSIARWSHAYIFSQQKMVLQIYCIDGWMGGYSSADLQYVRATGCATQIKLRRRAPSPSFFDGLKPVKPVFIKVLSVGRSKTKDRTRGEGWGRGRRGDLGDFGKVQYYSWKVL